MNLNVTIEIVAKHFSAVLREWLTAEEMAEIEELTKAETDSGICHTGDYCDSNMAMLDAMVRAGVCENEDDFNIENQEQVDLWNAAWDLAKQNLFYPPRNQPIV